MISAALISLGMLTRVLFGTSGKITKADILNIGGALFLAFLFFVQAEFWFPVFTATFGFVLLMMYRYKLLIRITEQIVLLYSLAALYIFWQTTPLPETFLSLKTFFFLFLFGIALYIFVLNVIRSVPDKIAKTTIILSFLILSTYILFTISTTFTAQENSIFAKFLIGFYGLQFAANISLILSYLPIGFTGKKDPDPTETLIKRTKKHIASMQRKYIDTETRPMQLVGILIAASFIMYLTYSDIGNWLELVTLFLFFSSLITMSTQRDTLS